MVAFGINLFYLSTAIMLLSLRHIYVSLVLLADLNVWHGYTLIGQ